MTIWRKCFACWICKATNTHSQYVLRIAFPSQQWLRERISMSRYTHDHFSLSQTQFIVSHNLTESHVGFLVQVTTPCRTARYLSNNLALHLISLFQVVVILALQPGCRHACQRQRPTACRTVTRVHVLQKWRRSCRISRRLESPSEIRRVY